MTLWTKMKLWRMAFLLGCGLWMAMPSAYAQDVGGFCQSTVKAKAFNTCAINCGNDGQCIFGCMVGQDFNRDRCYTNCNGFAPVCLDACLQTVDAIAEGCGLNKKVPMLTDLGTLILCGLLAMAALVFLGTRRQG